MLISEYLGSHNRGCPNSFRNTAKHNCGAFETPFRSICSSRLSFFRLNVWNIVYFSLSSLNSLDKNDFQTVKRMKKTLFLAFCLVLLTSCSGIVNDLINSSVEYDMQQGWESAKQNSTMTKANSKKVKKEQEKLKQEGKCPVCRGMGRSIDGKYVCSSCNGTGKYSQSE